MKNSFGILSLFTVGSLILSAGCGSSSDGDKDAGAAGTGAGISGAGTLATAGTMGNTAGTTAGVGTSVGDGGAAGSGSNGANCPATAPMDNDTCTVADTQCTYGAEMCDCRMGFGGFGGGGGMLQWNCGTNMAMQVCPDTAPAAGGTCEPGRGTCNFGMNMTCDCVNDSSKWACWDPADCPTTRPANDSACPVVGMQCRIGGGGGGRRGGCACTADGWLCTGGNNNNDDDAGM